MLEASANRRGFGLFYPQPNKGSADNSPTKCPALLTKEVHMEYVNGLQHRHVLWGPVMAACLLSGLLPVTGVSQSGQVVINSNSRTVTTSNFVVAWNTGNDTEAITSFIWGGGQNLTSTEYVGTCDPNYPGAVEYFGNSYAPPDPESGGLVLVGGGTTTPPGTTAWSGQILPSGTAQVTINSSSTGCPPSSAGINVETIYSFADPDDPSTNSFGVQRSFDFTTKTFNYDFRPYMPRLSLSEGFTEVLYPTPSGTLATENVYNCPIGCTGPASPPNAGSLNPSWDATQGWFAIHNPTTLEGVVVKRNPSTDPQGNPITAQLWVDNDAGSGTNVSSFLLLGPTGGFTGGLVTEVETFCFYNSTIWTPSLTPPAACSNGPVSLSPSTLTFGNQEINTPSAPQTETLTNTGTTSLSISTVAVGGTDPGDFATSADTCTGATLMTNDFCTINVTFSPTATGTVTGTLTITDNSNGVAGSLQTVSLSGTGTSTTAPTVTFTGAPASAVYNSTFTVASTTNASTTAVITASGACSVAGNTVTMTSGTGTCNLTATWAADSNYSAATASQSTTATKATPTVTFTAAPASAVDNSSFTVGSTTNASTTAVITASGACSVAGNTVTMTSGTGTCSLTATWAADNNYNAATATQSTTATKATPKVTFTGAPASAVYNSSFSVASTTNASTTAVITASGACSVAGNTVTMTSGAGPCNLTATWAADNNYNAATASQSTAATKAASTTAITSNSPNPSSVGQAVTVSFSVSGNGAPTGSVSVNASTGETCGGPLNAGAGSCSIVFNSAGARTLTASYAGDNNFTGGASTAANQTVNGGGTGSLVSLSSPGLSFGNEPLSTTSASQAETVTNTGNTSLSISAVTVGGTNAGDFAKSLDTCTGATVKPNGTCTVSVAFTPTALGNRSASLNFADNAANSPQTVALSGTGVQGAVLNPPALVFGSQAENTSSAPQTVTLTNTQYAALGISSVATSGDFTQTNTCGGSVPARSTCRISVTYTPSLLGGGTGTLTVTDTASNSPQTVSLAGTGIPQAALSPTSLLFSAETLGSTSPPWNVLLTNNLSTPLPISITLTGIDPGDFAQTNNCGGSVAAKSSCTISVTFKPVWTGTRVAALTVTDSANNSPQTVALSGFGE